ncbi:G_PROTEIN_RECEP_F1_2 domain-containing protein [Meloidogyne graminicola]|uniref:G_PROTEIN_RECEP_F1_2 domain-containing protein n=1 Tax=Meloidogyne graminicola TaxID=189291 RepID=A0A8S9ZEX6_9BILA|nr:G_PROTEIN_RECEP_F1_2 domain-containing protein [Meloidogyne graminicola]
MNNTSKLILNNSSSNLNQKQIISLASEDQSENYLSAASALAGDVFEDNNNILDKRIPAQISETLAPWQQQKISEDEFLASLPVFDMFPLSNGDENHVILYALLYAILFLVGVCGNISVITLIRHLHSNTCYDNTMVYVLFLCFVDLASVVPLPMAIMDQLLGFWMFGTTLCKIYRALEHVGRALSTFVLAAMAFDRFMRVCYPHRKTSRRMVFIQLFLLTLLTFVLLSPLLIKSSSRNCFKRTFFISYMFLIGFFLPILLITVFYALMMKRLFKRSRSLSSSKLPVNRIAGYTIAISVFFVICWSPYWISMLYFNFIHWENEDNEKQNNEDIFSSDKFIYIMYGIHALPYVNSSSNWLFYGLLNSQLLRRAKYTNDNYYNINGMTENGFFGKNLINGNNTITPPPPPQSSQIKLESSPYSRHSSLAITTKLVNGNGKYNSTISTPIVKKSTLINGQLINGLINFSPNLSSGGRSISSVSAPLRTITFSSIKQSENLNNLEKEAKQRLIGSQEINNDILL